MVAVIKDTIHRKTHTICYDRYLRATFNILGSKILGSIPNSSVDFTKISADSPFVLYSSN